MVNWILSSSLLILAVIVVRGIVKERISQRLRYALWALVLLRLLIPVNFGHSAASAANIPVALERRYIFAQQLPTKPVDAAVELPEEDFRETMTPLPSGTKTEEAEFSWREYLPKIGLVIWITGGIAVGGFFLFTNLHFGAMLRRTSHRLRGVRKGLTIRVSEGLDTPCLYGLVHPSIYVTPEVAENPTLLRHCVCHERCHYRHGDHIWAMLRGVCLVLHWYNPLVWWAAVLSRRDSELACDEAVIRQLGERERAEYGRTLIGMTCMKKGGILLAATTMNTKRSTILERIQMIARKPKTATATLVIMLVIGAAAAGCAFTGAKEATPEETLPPPSEESMAVSETTATEESTTEPAPLPSFRKQPEPGKVCIGIRPTGVSFAGDDFRYLIPEDQPSWMAAYESAIRSQTQELAWEGSSGYYVILDDAWWEITSSGAMLGTGGVSPENASGLISLCREALAAEGLPAPCVPEEFVGIRSASLDWNGVHTVTNPEDLRKIESMLTSSTEIRGAGCWFTGFLTLELANGEQRTIAMATDSCGTWMSEGVSYQYAHGNEEFYALFVTEAIHEALEAGFAGAVDLMVYLDWSRYANRYGQEETFSLMDQILDWVLEDPQNRSFSMSAWTRGLDGIYTDRYGRMLSQAYEADKPGFAWNCLGNAPDSVREKTLELLAYQWGVSKEEARATLRQQIE